MEAPSQTRPRKPSNFWGRIRDKALGPRLGIDTSEEAMSGKPRVPDAVATSRDALVGRMVSFAMGSYTNLDEILEGVQTTNTELLPYILARRATIPLPSYLLCFLRAQDTPPVNSGTAHTAAQQMPTQEPDQAQILGASMWQILCRRAEDTRNKRQVTSSLQALPLNEYLGVKSVLNAGGRERQDPMWKHRVWNATGTTTEPDTPWHREPGPGPGIQEALERLEKWLQHAARPMEARALLDERLLNLRPLVLRNAWFAANRKDARVLAGFLYHTRVESSAYGSAWMVAGELFDNPHFTEDGFRGIVDALLEDIRQILQDRAQLRSMETWPEELFARARARHWKTDERHDRALRTILADFKEAWREGHTVAHHKAASYLSQLRATGEDAEACAHIIARGNPHLNARLARNLQGPDWVQAASLVIELAKHGSPLADGQEWTAAVKVARDADEWNLKGVARMDLIPLISATHPEVRYHGMRLAELQRKLDKT